ncbi:hypothetical protein EVAR_52824_1 [Eumeta japonica]|uniref:Uncharacterized protein n=1 Tax=Eumeta variegata TaxID=151549 RepID=A0A4C1YBD6_EUMVA|nr:hypothetical protein EVAR_52824_1 [Eumeta japonica]
MVFERFESTTDCDIHNYICSSTKAKKCSRRRSSSNRTKAADARQVKYIFNPGPTAVIRVRAPFDLRIFIRYVVKTVSLRTPSGSRPWAADPATRVGGGAFDDVCATSSFHQRVVVESLRRSPSGNQFRVSRIKLFNILTRDMTCDTAKYRITVPEASSRRRRGPAGATAATKAG